MGCASGPRGEDSVTGTFDTYRKTYEQEVEDAIAFAGREHDFYLEAKARVLLELAAQRLGDLGRVQALDVGCGLGLVHQHLAPLAGRLEGIDVSPALIEEASRRNPSVRYRTFDGRRTPYEDGSFDLVFAICVLHHVDPPARSEFVQELVRITRDGGVVAVFEHNPLNPLTRLVVRRCAFDEGVVLVRRRQLERLLAGEATQGLRSRYMLFTPWRATSGVERRLGRIPLGAQYVTYASRV
jgi:SAM-dependent methyltransferase